MSSYNIISYHISYHIILYHIIYHISYHIISYYIISYHMSYIISYTISYTNLNLPSSRLDVREDTRSSSADLRLPYLQVNSSYLEGSHCLLLSDFTFHSSHTYPVRCCVTYWSGRVSLNYLRKFRPSSLWSHSRGLTARVERTVCKPEIQTAVSMRSSMTFGMWLRVV
jgi:hypothetical protein